ncbi:MAG: zf-HC2 domain-containing protein [Acidobacteria bacterium]|nr:zf-HC2 domain-containing protein [Acidobacteriota bacterium]
MRRCLSAGTLRGYFDGEISDEEVVSVTAHLASCEDCAVAAREMEEGIESLRQAFAPLISLPVPAARLQARLNTSISALPPPKSGLVATVGFNVSALLTWLSHTTNRTPRLMEGFATLTVVLMLFVAAVIYQLQPPVKEQAENENATAASSVPVARAGQEALAGSGAFADSSISKGAQALSSGVGHPLVMAVNKVSSKSARHVEHRGRRAKSHDQRQESSSLLAEGKSLIPGEQKQLAHIATLTASLEGGAKPLQPILRVEYERNLAVVDVAIKATRRIALNNPRDKNAAEFLLAAYQSKINLLRAVASQAEPAISLLED